MTKKTLGKKEGRKKGRINLPDKFLFFVGGKDFSDSDAITL
jgi:hypothetical protein